MIALISVLFLGVQGKVVDFTSILYPLTTWPESSHLNCSSYQCDPSPPTWGAINSTCIRVNSTAPTTFLLNPCPYPQRQNSYCPPLYAPSLPSNCTVPMLLYPKLYPNEEGCRESLGCINGGVCVEDVCMGTNYTQPCTSNNQCNPGLRCLESSCMVLLKEGDYGCFSDEDCVNYCGCDRNAFASEYGTCTRYFSLPTGSPVNACDQFNSLLCESGQCIPGLEFGAGQCIDAFKTAQGSPRLCTKVEQCYAQNENVTVFSDCVCGLNSAGNSYCQPFLGDSPGVTLIENLKQWIGSEYIAGCNTERRFDWHCMKTWATGKADSLKLALTHYNMFVELQGNDECVMAIYTPEYYDALQAVNRDAATTISLAIGVALGVFS